MSEVEKYWEAIRSKTNDPRSWNDLHMQEQMLVIQSINLLLMVMNNRPNNEQS